MATDLQTAVFFVVCDLHSKCLLQPNNSMIFPDKIPNDFGAEKDVETGTWNIVFNQLYADGYITKGILPIESPQIDQIRCYFLTAAGRIFIEKGGYATLFSEQVKMQALQEEQTTSVIETNTSVKSTNTIQKLSLVATFIIILIGGLIQFKS